MIKESCVFIGVGQGGCNIVQEFEQDGCNAFYVNTSLEDLDTIDTSIKNKYHIEGLKGMAKDRQYALEVITDENNIADTICRAIYERYANAKIYYFVFTSSGGTGGTMGGILAEAFGEIYGEEDKFANVITVLPRDIEDLGMQYNARESLNQIKEAMKNGNITNVQILDNNSREDKMKVNKDFAITFSRLLNFENINAEGNFDESEIEVALTAPGIYTMIEFEDDDFGNGLANAVDKSVYAKSLKNPSVNGMILNKKYNNDLSLQLIREEFGVPKFTHSSIWNDETNIILASGMSFNENLLNHLASNYNTLLQKKKEIEESIKEQLQETIELESDLMNSFNRRKHITSSTTKKTRRRASSIREKYQNLGK